MASSTPHAAALATVRRWTLPSWSGPTRGKLFIFHGTHEHSGRDCYAELAAACNGVNIEAFAFDFCGHGRRAEGARGDFGALDEAVAEAVALVVSESGGAAGAGVPIILFGHSLGSMVTFLAAHELAKRPELPTPACVVLSGFAMDSVSPPFGVSALTPVLRAVPSVVRAVCTVLSALQPTGPACPLPPATALMSDPERAARASRDPLQHQGWIQNRTAVALLDARAKCTALLGEWGAEFPFLLVHGGRDALCPRSAVDALLAASPQPDKAAYVYKNALHEVLNDVVEVRERARREIVSWIEKRIGALRSRL